SDDGIPRVRIENVRRRARAEAGQRRRELLLGRDFDPDVRGVPKTAGREPRRQAGLIRRDGVLALVALPRDAHLIRHGVVGRDVLHGGDDGFALRAVVPRLISQREIAIDVMLDPRGVAVLPCLVVVVAGTPVEVALIDWRCGANGCWGEWLIEPGGAGN